MKISENVKDMSKRIFVFLLIMVVIYSNIINYYRQYHLLDNYISREKYNYLLGISEKLLDSMRSFKSESDILLISEDSIIEMQQNSIYILSRKLNKCERVKPVQDFHVIEVDVKKGYYYDEE